jgi:Flp pilus assembly protein TadB
MRKLVAACVPGGQRGNVEAMRRHQRVTGSGLRRPQSERLRRRQRWYFALMGVCLVLILLAWNLVRLWSTTAAVAMSVVAAVLVPIAVLIANWGEDR